MFRYIQKRLLFINQGTVTLDVAINRFDEKIKSSRAFTISKYTKFSAFSTQQFQPVFRRRRRLLHPGKVRHGA